MKNAPVIETDAPTAILNIDTLVEQHYEALYRFAVTLSGNASDAADLTQETYRVLLIKGGQIRDPRKAKTWLFTTLYRRFLGQRRRASLRSEVSLDAVEDELPALDPHAVERLDGASVRLALHNLPEKYRAPLAMFYLQQFSYREIANVLAVPIGTVMSRISRGKQLLRRQLNAGLRPARCQPMDRAARTFAVPRREFADGFENGLAVTAAPSFAGC